MAYNHEYPYTDPNRYNDDWLLNKMKELEAKIQGIEDDILRDAKKYIDEELDRYIREVEALRSELFRFEIAINSQFDDFKTDIGNRQANFERIIEARIDVLEARVNAFRDELTASIIGVNARTDLAIEQNNEFIFSVISDDLLGELFVTNFFTGSKVTVQEMFNYLSQLHIDDGITYSELIIRNKTYNELADLGIDYTNLVLHGGSLIV